MPPVPKTLEGATFAPRVPTQKLWAAVPGGCEGIFKNITGSVIKGLGVCSRSTGRGQTPFPTLAVFSDFFIIFFSVFAEVVIQSKSCVFEAKL